MRRPDWVKFFNGIKSVILWRSGVGSFREQNYFHKEKQYLMMRLNNRVGVGDALGGDSVSLVASSPPACRPREILSPSSGPSPRLAANKPPIGGNRKGPRRAWRATAWSGVVFGGFGPPRPKPGREREHVSSYHIEYCPGVLLAVCVIARPINRTASPAKRRRSTGQNTALNTPKSSIIGDETICAGMGLGNAEFRSAIDFLARQKRFY